MASVGEGRVEDGDAVLARRTNVDLVRADAEAADRHQLWRGSEHVGGDPRAGADAENMGVGDGLAQVVAVERLGQALHPLEAGGGEQVERALVDAFQQQYAKVLAVGNERVDHGSLFEGIRRRGVVRRTGGATNAGCAPRR